MSVKQFKFVSPGVFINEIDNSQITNVGFPPGPVIIGRTERGPAFQPITVNSFSEYIDIFGNPSSGGPKPAGVGDVYRDGQLLGPTYAAYAAQAWLRNNGPATIVRVLGDEHDAQDGTTYARAGWNAGSVAGPGPGTGGAYGLFLFNSASYDTAVSGTLAAVWYFNDGGMALTGTLRGAATTDGDSEETPTSGSNAAFQSIGTNEFKAHIYNSSEDEVETTTFNFTPTSNNYIRKVFNTNPTLTNSDIVSSNSQAKNYFLGETYDRMVEDHITGEGSGATYGMILGLGTTAISGADRRIKARSSQTGWFISQDLRNTSANKSDHSANVLDPVYSPMNANVVTKLFKFHSLHTGEWEMRNLKISIQDIKASTAQDSDPYGTFTVVIRHMGDSDNAVRIVERYTGCNLNPNSTNYIARKIGDVYREYDTTRRRLVEYGNYANRSNFLRVEMNTSVDASQAHPELLPFGVYGPPKFKDFTILSGDSDEAGNAAGYDILNDEWDKVMSGSVYLGSPSNEDNLEHEAASSGAGNLFIRFGGGEHASGIYRGTGSVGTTSGPMVGHVGLTASFLYPELPLRVSSSAGNLADPTDAYFGVTTNKNNSSRFDKSIVDLTRPLPSGVDSFAVGDLTQHMFVFSLDDLAQDDESGSPLIYSSGSRGAGNSITAVSGSWRSILNKGYDRFTTVLHGGANGWDITEAEPLNESRSLTNGATERNSSAFFSVKKAIDICADPEFVDYNLMVAPGITNEGLTAHMINTCEDRGDALAIIDPMGGYLPWTENANAEKDRITAVSTVTDNMRDRGMNSSYGAAYFPWVQIRDSINGSLLWAPPSVVALGTIGSSENKTAPWFAPAGFTRGGLTEGAAGVPVVGVRTKLTSKDRDNLYEANINPIASFPAEGIVIFGQKTLQVTPSALDRINVRRMLIFVKKEISRISSTLLFDQNVQATWNRFLGEVQPFLTNVKSGLGLSDFRVVLDETTTTDDLIDRNIMYAKIFLKPARAIEFIALDFVVSSTGAAFED